MKANRKFKNKDDDAVSAVIGVILMVAITVAIAATVYVYVSGMIGTSPQSTPSLQLVKDDINDKLTVASADPGDLSWTQLNITYDGDYSNLKINEESYSSDDNGAIDISDIGNVKAGDYIKVESGTCNASIRHIPTNTLIGTWSFN
mgnify:FL=1